MSVGAPVQYINYQFLDSANGTAIPLVGGLLYTYAAGTNTPLATYSDYALTTPNTNPVVCDSAGYTPGGIWVGSSAYKFVLKRSDGTTVWTKDHVTDLGQLLQANMATTTGASLSGYLQLGGSAVASTALAKMRDIVSGAADYALVGDGSTDNHVALQAMINSGRPDIYLGPDINGGKVYSIGSTTLTIDRTNGGPNRFIMAHGCSLKYSGTGAAVVIQNYEPNALIQNGGEFNLSVQKTSDGWTGATDTTSIGVKVIDCSNCVFRIPTLLNFRTSFQMTNVANDTVSNQIYFCIWYQTKIGLHHKPVAPYGVNSNTYVGGSMGNDGGLVAGTKKIQLDSGSDNQNLFLNLNLQGANVAMAIDCAGSWNIFESCRFEASVLINLTGDFNSIYNPFMSNGTYSIITDTGHQNAYCGAIGVRLDSDGGAARLLDFYDSSVSSSTRILTFRPDKGRLAVGADLTGPLLAAGNNDRIQANTATAGSNASLSCNITAGAVQPQLQIQIDDSTTPKVGRLVAGSFLTGGHGVNIGLGSYEHPDDVLYDATNRLLGVASGARFKATQQLFAALPAASAAFGQIALVQDSNTITWGATIAGGGVNSVLAWSNGANWTVMGI